MSNFAAIANGSTTSPYYSIEQVPIPNVPKDKILIKTVAFAANPTDWKHIELGYVSSGSILGTDVSGIVIEVGSDVTGFAKETMYLLGYMEAINPDRGLIKTITFWILLRR